jgi:biotin synthase
MREISQDGYVRALNAGANLATINLTPRAVRADYPIYKRDRVVMDEERVLSAIEQAGCALSPVGVSAHQRNAAEVVSLNQSFSSREPSPVALL